MSRVPRRRSLLGLAGAGLIAMVAACGGGPTSSSVTSPAPVGSSTPTPAASPAATARAYRLGLSNSVAGDPWRTAMVCTAKAQARVSERVDRLLLADRGTDAAGQAADLRNLVATGVDAVIVAPLDPVGLEEAVAEAVAAGVVVVAVGRAIAVEGTYAVVTDQDAFGFAGATCAAAPTTPSTRNATRASAEHSRERRTSRSSRRSRPMGIQHWGSRGSTP